MRAITRRQLVDVDKKSRSKKDEARAFLALRRRRRLDDKELLKKGAAQLIAAVFSS